MEQLTTLRKSALAFLHDVDDVELQIMAAVRLTGPDSLDQLPSILSSLTAAPAQAAWLKRLNNEADDALRDPSHLRPVEPLQKQRRLRAITSSFEQFIEACRSRNPVVVDLRHPGMLDELVRIVDRSGGLKWITDRLFSAMAVEQACELLVKSRLGVGTYARTLSHSSFRQLFDSASTDAERSALAGAVGCFEDVPTNIRLLREAALERHPREPQTATLTTLAAMLRKDAVWRGSRLSDRLAYRELRALSRAKLSDNPLIRTHLLAALPFENMLSHSRRSWRTTGEQVFVLNREELDRLGDHLPADDAALRSAFSAAEQRVESLRPPSKKTA